MKNPSNPIQNHPRSSSPPHNFFLVLFTSQNNADFPHSYDLRMFFRRYASFILAGCLWPLLPLPCTEKILADQIDDLPEKSKTGVFTKEKSRFFFVLNRTASHVVYHRFLSPEIKGPDTDLIPHHAAALGPDP